MKIALTGAELFVRDHLWRGSKVLPAAAHLELARAAVVCQRGGGGRPDERIELERVTWARPVIVGEAGLELHVILRPMHDRVGFEISECAADNEYRPASSRAIYSRGYARPVRDADGVARLDIEALRARCQREFHTAEHCYAVLSQGEMSYGPAQQGLSSVATGVDDEGHPVALAKLCLPSQWQDDAAARYFVHPCIVDSALQAAVSFTSGACALKPTRARLPFFAGRVTVWASTAQAVWAYLQLAEARAAQPGMKLGVDICAADGTVCMQVRDFCFR